MEDAGRYSIFPSEQRVLTQHIDHLNSIFIRDGVVCPEKWFAQKVRPLFLLKETYGGDADWDLTADHLLSTRPASKMWNRISLWTKGILATTKESIAPFVAHDPKAKKYGNEYIRQIAVINVKKINLPFFHHLPQQPATKKRKLSWKTL